MRNSLTIARREIGSALASPIAYVLFGSFAFLYGFFFTDYLRNFVEAGMRMSQMGGFSGGSLHVNADLIRWLMGSVAVILLFLTPLLTMRAFSEDIRSGTLELLLTAPVTDGQIVFGKFLGGFALYGAMLGITALPLGVLFLHSEPEIAPILAGYLGLSLFGAGVVALGLFFSSLTRSQVVAGLSTFAFLLVSWLLEFASLLPGDAGRALAYLSVSGHTFEFARGVITTRDLVFHLSFAGFFLFLARESVRSRRWRG